MKQYKFKYKGKWYDISSTVFGNYHATAHKQYKLSRESYFQVMEPTLPKLIKALKALNIDVVEIYDKVKWSKWDSDYGGYLSKYVFRDNIPGRYRKGGQGRLPS